MCYLFYLYLFFYTFVTSNSTDDLTLLLDGHRRAASYENLPLSPFMPGKHTWREFLLLHNGFCLFHKKNGKVEINIQREAFFGCLHFILNNYCSSHLETGLIHFRSNLPMLPCLYKYLFICCLFVFLLFIFCWSCSYRLAALCCSSERWVGGAWAFYDPSSSSFHPVKCLTTINLNSPP